MKSSRLILRHALTCVFFALGYLLLNRPEIVFFSRLGLVAWYPAVGLAMALMVGLSPWYAIPTCLSVALASSLIYRQPLLSFSSTVDAFGIGACYGGVAYLLRGPLRIDLALSRRSDVVRYIVVSISGALLATAIGILCLIGDHAITPAEYTSSAIVWFLGDVIGLVSIAPFLLVHVLPQVRTWLSAASDPPPDVANSKTITLSLGALGEISAQFVTIAVVIWVMFGLTREQYSHFYLCFIPIIWIAMRHGVGRVVWALLALNFGIVLALHLFPPNIAVFNNVSILMLIVSTVGLIVGSEVSERERLALDLNEQTSFLNSLIENSPMAIVVLNRKGSVDLVNSAFEKLFECSRTQLKSMDVAETTIPEIEAKSSASLLSDIFAGNALHRTIRKRSRDGQILELALHGVPVRLNGEVSGAHLIYEDISEQARAAEAQREHAESLDRLVKELEVHSNHMYSLSELGTLLACSGTVKEACEVVAVSLRKLFPAASFGSLYLFRASRDLLETVAAWGRASGSAETFTSDACWALRRGHPHWISDRSDAISCRHLTHTSNVECVCVPMVAQGNTLGVLHLQFTTSALSRQEFGMESGRSAHEQLAVSAASQIALSLASLHLRETLRDQAIRDPLTRLFNRRFLEESLERELQLAGRKKQSLAVLFLDLDHFKKFNDAFGHDAGDIVLQSLADLFRDFFRSTDICCRYGGEEFAIILPESSAEDTVARANALRQEVKKLRLQHKKQPLGQLTISAGVAGFPEHASTSTDLLSAADQCLYQSKARGRDVVTMASTQKA